MALTKYFQFSFVLLFLLLTVAAHAQPAQGLIYGKITLKNGATYQGQIRWDNEDALWDDVFSARKYERPSQNLLTKEEARRATGRSDDFKFGFMKLWEDKSPEINFSFRCQFGDLVSLTAGKKDVVRLGLKNGDVIKLKKGGGGNLNDNIRIYDRMLGRLDLNFEEIQSIVFASAPTNYSSPAGHPIYGQALTSMGVYEGYITWDLEECLGKDLISGKDQGVKVDINFEDIAELKAQKDGSLITLKSGRTIFLNDHDDVDRGNHGLMIRNLAFGKLIIKWEDFISISFLEPPVAPRAYRDFKLPQLLKGSVYTKDGRRLQGQIVYDLDEIYSIEFLNGRKGKFEYYIPFEKVVKIKPQNDKFSTVHLKDGQQFLLGNHADVTGQNHGIVIKLPNGQAQYLEWDSVKSIDFE